MSSHVSINCHVCGAILNDGHDSLPGGLAPLLAALGAPVREWSGKNGVDVLPALQGAIMQLEDDMLRDDYRRRFAAPDSWSRVDFVEPFLRSMRDAICRDPQAVIHAD
jgi:hypothetical protein